MNKCNYCGMPTIGYNLICDSCREDIYNIEDDGPKSKTIKEMKMGKISFDRISLINRWVLHKYSRNCDWVIFGVQQWWAGPENFCYKICLFGIDIQIWFTRTFNK